MAVEGKGRPESTVACQWARKTWLYIRTGACTRRGLQLVVYSISRPMRLVYDCRWNSTTQYSWLYQLKVQMDETRLIFDLIRLSWYCIRRMWCIPISEILLEINARIHRGYSRSKHMIQVSIVGMVGRSDEIQLSQDFLHWPFDIINELSTKKKCQRGGKVP